MAILGQQRVSSGTHSNKVQLESITQNELGNPEAILLSNRNGLSKIGEVEEA
jgi:hypothetical protein